MVSLSTLNYDARSTIHQNYGIVLVNSHAGFYVIWHTKFGEILWTFAAKWQILVYALLKSGLSKSKQVVAKNEI